jgi:hypothetical protein
MAVQRLDGGVGVENPGCVKQLGLKAGQTEFSPKGRSPCMFRIEEYIE